MVELAYIVAGAAVAGAIASWVLGAHYAARAMSDTGTPTGLMLRALFAWPFWLGALRDRASASAANVNKALVSCLACVIIATSAISVATNLARVSR